MLSVLNVQHTFLVRFFDVALHDYNVKLPGFMEGMSYEFLLTYGADGRVAGGHTVGIRSRD